MSFQEQSYAVPFVPPAKYVPGQSGHDPITEALMKLVQRLDAWTNPPFAPVEPGGIKELEITNTSTSPVQIRIAEGSAGIVKGFSGFLYGDFLPPLTTRTDGMAWSARGLVYDVSGTLAAAYFYGPDFGRLEIPLQAIEFRNNANGTGNARTPVDGYRSGDYLYIKDGISMTIPDISTVESITLIYMPKVPTPPAAVAVGSYQPPFVSNPVVPPIGELNAALLDFGFTTTRPEVSFYDSSTGVPNYAVYWKPVMVGNQTHSLYFWTDSVDAMSVNIKVAP